MSFDYEFSQSLTKVLKKVKKKDKVLFEATIKKIREIVRNPERYKHLSHNMKRQIRVHIKKSFVLTFKVKEDLIEFLDLDHHDNVYDTKR